MFQLTDKKRAALIGVAQSTFPMLVGLGVTNRTDSQIGLIMVFITNAITYLALAFPSGQGSAAPGPVSARDVEDIIDAYVAKMRLASG